MEFAKKQLEKYGWKEGEGLGKNKTGISKAIKPKLKFDTGGLGHDVFDVNNTWWQRLYDEAAKNVVTKKDCNDSIFLETVNHSVEITTKKKKSKERKNLKDAIYKDFVKTSELIHNIETNISREDDAREVSVRKMTSGICDLTDEELFNACGGRTGHKGARHGLKMNAKLARLEQQENNLFPSHVEAGPTKKINESHKNHKKKNKKKKEKI